MSYNIVENGKLKNITGPVDATIIEGKPIYGERRQYATNKKIPLNGQASLKYTIDIDGILTGSCHKAGQGYSAWLRMNGKSLVTFDNYGGESCSFDFPNVRVKAGDVIELTSNVPTTETTNFFWLNNIGVTSIIGVEPGIELQAQDIYSTNENIVGTWTDGKPIYRKVLSYPTVGNKDVSTLSIDSIISFDFKSIDTGAIFFNGSVPTTTSTIKSSAYMNKTKTTINLEWEHTGYTLERFEIVIEYTKK